MLPIFIKQSAYNVKVKTHVLEFKLISLGFKKKTFFFFVKKKKKNCINICDTNLK